MRPTAAIIGAELNPIPPIRGGAEELYIDKMTSALAGWRGVILCPDDPDLPAHEVRGQVEYFRVPLAGVRRWLYLRYRHRFPLYERGLARILAKVRPQLIQVHNRPLLALALKERYFPGVPVLLRMGNLGAILGKRERPAPGTRLPLDAFVACSRYILESERDGLGLGAASHWVVPNGVDTGTFAPRSARQAEARHWRERWGLAAGAATVLFVGKIRESKGVGVLVAAMDRVWREVPGTTLVLAGGTEFGRGRTDRETPFFRDLRGRLDQARGRVILTGFIPPTQVSGAYLLGDIFVAPSQKPEGMPLTVLEASASGLPIISTRQGGIPEVVEDGGSGFLLQSKDDAAELAEKILELLKDEGLRERLGRRGREVACQNFAFDRIARLQEEVFDAVMKAAATR